MFMTSPHGYDAKYESCAEVSGISRIERIQIEAQVNCSKAQPNLVHSRSTMED